MEEVPVRGLKALDEVQIGGPNKFGGMGLSPIKGLSGLRKLSLSSLGLSDEALSNLSGLTRLESLGLHGSRVTDNGPRNVLAFPKTRHWADIVGAMESLQAA